MFPKRKYYREGTYLFEQGEVMHRKTAFVVLEGQAKVQIIEKVRGCKITARSLQDHCKITARSLCKITAIHCL